MRKRRREDDTFVMQFAQERRVLERNGTCWKRADPFYVEFFRRSFSHQQITFLFPSPRRFARARRARRPLRAFQPADAGHDPLRTAERPLFLCAQRLLHHALALESAGRDSRPAEWHFLASW